MLKYIITIILTTSFYAARSQDNPLEQQITIEANNVTIEELLEEISEKATIEFSYNPDLIQAHRRIDLSVESKTVRAVLNEIFDRDFTYKVRGNYVIITKAEVTSEDRSEAKTKTVSGYVLDLETKKGIPEVSIFTASGENIISEADGGFKIKLQQKDDATIELRKSGYQSLSYNHDPSWIDRLEILMTAEKSLIVTMDRDSSLVEYLPQDEPQIVHTIFPISTDFQVHQENIPDTLYKPVSFSLYPGISTYGDLSGNIIFNFTMNFVGYNRGINGVELAALSNINRDDVTGVQLAGLSNYTGGNVSGVQGAGIFNTLGGDFDGVQMAGITNYNRGKTTGIQLAGVTNHTWGKSKGVQMSGIFNQADTLKGIQMTSVWNMSGYQHGLQISGVGNMVKKINGWQVAGVFNGAEEVDGVQISGLVNYGKKVKGSQIGIINIADSLSGIPIGLFNYVSNGYRRFGYFADEILPVNIELKTGVNKFYTMLTAGVQSEIIDEDDALFSYGVGFGSSASITEALSFDLNVSHHTLTKKGFTDNTSNIIKGYLGLELKLFGRLSLAAGGTYNAFYFDRELLDDPDFDQLRGSYLLDTSNDNDTTVWRSWIGYRLGVRIII